LTSSSWPDTSDSTNRSMKSRTWAESGSIAVPLSWAGLVSGGLVFLEKRLCMCL
jgi:hypothetical protein